MNEHQYINAVMAAASFALLGLLAIKIWFDGRDDE